MKMQTTIAVAAALVSGVMLASAPASAALFSSSHAKAADSLTLPTDQQKTAWNDLNSAATVQKAPPSFFQSVGEAVPSSVKLQPMPAKASSDVPALRPYDFAKIEGKLLIVNPTDRKIAEVITHS